MSHLQLAALKLKQYSDADLSFLTRLYITVRRDEFQAANWPETQLTQFLTQQFSAQYDYYCQHYCADSFNIIFYQSQPIGRLFVEYRHDDIRVVDISLLPEYRNKGIASYYFQQLFDQAKSSQRCVTIHVERNNPARHLYERLGFKFKSQTDDVYLLMQWQLDN
ncbi:GNAT family N-acetyltransferase [Shewanella sp. Scap07]|uniref:GNAT family N-acetyltransferase n=1 Tax=Shewanella sp. Scap07 TaxID=2589987 RepID=UPI0015BA0C1C|nr:GNAT family N-acetyltransferase [Shewanella sp. Scap07]QLE87647.1 GNAT family N-acetyltransferase [Shewanella sp. Scap07]